MPFLSNKTYSIEPVDEDNILPLRNASTILSAPSLAYGYGYYYLLYRESNSEIGSSQYAIAKSQTPMISKSWSKIGNLGYPSEDFEHDDLERATLLWAVNGGSHHIYFGHINYNSNNEAESLEIRVTQSTDDLNWQNSSKTIVKEIPSFFTVGDANPGPSPLPVKSGDFVFLYSTPAFWNASINYAILKREDPTEVIQRGDEPLMPEIVNGTSSIITRGLIKNPRGCPENATDEFSPEFADNIECFLGIYTFVHNSDPLKSNFYNLFVSWIELDSSTTTTSESTESSNIETSKRGPITTEKPQATSASITTEKFQTTVPSGIPPFLIIIASALLLPFISCVIIFIIYRRRRNSLRNSFINMFAKQTQISKKDAKIFTKSVDQFELNSKQITVLFDEKLGSGLTSNVYKGFLSGDSAILQNAKSMAFKIKYSNCNVAIKISKDRNRSEMEQIMRELQAMKKIGYHSHISVLLGWCFQSDLPSLVFELAQSDLYTYVYSFRNSENTLSCLPLKELLSIGWQISVGMEHVASFKIIHRDLATRNILLFDGLHAKISDFGLCCFCDDTFTYSASWEKKLPIRWLSLEALMDKRFSEKSDVWAFGVLLYEMWSNGAVPYSLMSNHEIINFLQSGGRLEKPETIASEMEEEIYQLMLDCWEEVVDERPSFSEITERLNNLLEEETKRYGYLAVPINENV